MLTFIMQNPLKVAALIMVMLYVLACVVPHRFERPLKAVALISIVVGLFFHGTGS